MSMSAFKMTVPRRLLTLVALTNRRFKIVERIGMHPIMYPTNVVLTIVYRYYRSEWPTIDGI